MISRLTELPTALFAPQHRAIRGTEDIGIAPVVITPFELGDVQLEIFAADFVVTAHDASFNSDHKPSRVCVWTTPSAY
jgi:hypothetical protein